MERVLESSFWKIRFEEYADPLWIIVAIAKNEDSNEDNMAVLLGVCSAEDKATALASVPEDETEAVIFMDAFNLMSTISQSEMMQKVSRIIDTASEE